MYLDNEVGYNDHLQSVNTLWTRAESYTICLYHKKEGAANMAFANSQYKMQPSTLEAHNSCSSGKAWVGHVSGIGNRCNLTEDGDFQKTETAIIWVMYRVVAC